MVSFDYKIVNSIGLHVRPAGMIAEAASRYRSQSTVTFNDQVADAKGMFMLMVLGAACGDTITVSSEGPDEEEAIKALRAAVEKGLGQDC